MTTDILELSRSEAQHIAVTVQHLNLNTERVSARQVLEQLGCIQIDAMQAVRRSQDLVLLARGVEAADVATITGLSSSSATGMAQTFETWGHAHSLMPVSIWPFLAFRRRSIAKNGLNGPEFDPDTARHVLKVVQDEGPKTLSDLDQAVGKGWDRQSPSRWACEWLLSTGRLVCTERNDKWQRVYSLPEDRLPPELLHHDPHDDACYDEIVRRSLAALGIATAADVADYFRISRRAVTQALARGGYETARVEGSKGTWYLASAQDRPISKDKSGSVGKRLVPLSPLDSLVWTRGRQQTIFGKDYRLEAYKPASKREFGYFGMPLLFGDELVGRIAARRNGTTLLIEATELDRDLPADQIGSLKELLTMWSGCADIQELA